MQSVDLQVIGTLVDWLKAGQQTYLCTVVKTWGSSPRPAGSLLACTAGGDLAGSLSGGCVEDDLIDQLQAGMLVKDRPQCLEYGLNTDDNERLGLPCGGTLKVVVEPLNASHSTHFQALADALKARQCLIRKVAIADGAMTLTPTARPTPLVYDESDPQSPLLSSCFGPKNQLFVIGAGMVSMYLADIANKLDFKTIICDPRENMIRIWSAPDTTTLNLYPDDAIRAHADDAMTAIVAVTHDPRIDDMGMMEALHTKAFYVGAMGSQKTSAKRRERLRALDVSEAALARLRAPIGLAIGSKTPPEIALSIMAEITAARAAVDTSPYAFKADDGDG